MSDVNSYELRYRSVKLLRAARAFFPLTDLSKITGLPLPMLSRYINGSTLPSEGNARKIVDSLLSREVITALVAKAVRVYNGFYNIAGVTLDPMALTLISEYVVSRFDGAFTCVMTPEAGGISLATAIGLTANVPIVVARKQRPPSEEPVLETMYLSGPASYTVFYVTKRELPKDSKVLIVDDFSIHGHTLRALVELVRKAGASLAGTVVVVAVGTDWKVTENSEALIEIRG
ncbi:MAG: phosphoribosyltransferase family protein [Acidilobus sp.]|uniref:phosphoribosyltransferase family protein n=1 Tax=Acidilobus sp. 7A TaxID=1577685 RepID=UPI000E3DD2AD|nr:phosphoribosyltransferase family protein [Acidilobus sp. 7A]